MDRSPAWLLAAVVVLPALFLLPTGPLTITPRAALPATAAPAPGGTALLAEASASLASGQGPVATPSAALNRTWTDSLQPPASTGGPMTWDGADGYVLLYDEAVGSTWAYVHERWSQVAGAAETPDLSNAELAYDAKDGYVLAFGVGDHCSPNCNATWTYLGGRWTNVTSTLSQSPPGRAYAQMTYDGRDGYIVLFGGYAYRASPVCCYPMWFNDTWTYVGGNWTQQHPAGRSPPAVEGAGFAYDAPDQYVILFGGYGYCNTRGGGPQCADTWSYSAGNWTLRLTTKAPYPPGFQSEVFTVDPSSGYPIAFGGYGTGSVGNETWEYRAGHWHQLAPAVSPPAEAGATGAPDPVDNATVVFGVNPYAYTGSTWYFAGGNWTFLFPRAPPTTFLPAMTYDGAIHHVLLFGGASPSSPRGQTWEYDTGGWVRLNPVTSPSPRFGAAMMYDAKDREVVLFGGCGSGGNPTRCPKVLGDTWAFAGNNWTNLTASLTSAPPARYAAAITYDSLDGYVLLFGGSGKGTVGLLNDTWSFVRGAWTRLPSTVAPSPREYAALANDPSAGAVLLFGGCGSSSCPLGDTWSFVAGNWTRLAVPHAPLPRYGASIWYDAAGGDLLLEGGIVACGSTMCLNAATWTYGNGIWTKLAPSISPPLGAFAGRAYDGLDGYPMLFGGCPNVACSAATNSTWYWTPT